MATILSLGRSRRRDAPSSSRLRRLDELGPVLLLAAVLAVLVAAAYESRAPRSEAVSGSMAHLVAE